MMIGILGLSLLMNQGVLILETFRNFKLSCKRCLVRRRKNKRKAMQKRSVDQLMKNTGSLVAKFEKDNKIDESGAESQTVDKNHLNRIQSCKR